MARVPVPDDYDRGVITVAGTHDHLHGEADVNLDDRRHARHLKVSEGEAGYVNVNANYAEAVAAFLGVSVEGESGASGGASDDTASGSDDDEDADDGLSVAEIEQVMDDGVCPWCDDYEGDGVPQHASSAHPDEWAEYKED